MRVNMEEIKNVCLISYLLLAYAINSNGWCKYRVTAAHIGENNTRFFCACSTDSWKRERGRKKEEGISMYSVRFIAPHYILDPSSLYARVHNALGISIIRRGISYCNVEVNTTMSSAKVFTHIWE